MIDRTPTKVIESGDGVGAIRYGEYDEQTGELIAYRYLKPADEPVSEGTPLNKANLLTDDTAAKYGLGAAAVPNDMWNALGGLPIPAAKGGTGVTSLPALLDALGAAKIGVIERTGAGSTNFTITFSFTPKIVFMQNMSAAGIFAPYTWGQTSMWYGDNAAGATVSGNQLTLTPGPTVVTYFDNSGKTYRYIAIG